MSSITHAIRQSCNQVFNSHRKTKPQQKSRVAPLRLRLIGFFFNVAARVNREWAADRLSDLWFTVFQPRPGHRAQAFWSQADKSFELHLTDKSIQAYSWGQGPLVVCIHGWGGSGTQFKALIPELVESGYQVVTFDAPAHGYNPGNKTHVMEFALCLNAIQQQLGSINTVVAHSFGAMATLIASYMGLEVPRMVFIVPGLDVQELFARYADNMKLDPGLGARFREIAGDKMSHVAPFGDPWTFFRPAVMLPHASEQGLLIYDTNDEEISLQQFETSARHWPSAEKLKTSGLGHYRILKDASVINRISQWMSR